MKLSEYAVNCSILFPGMATGEAIDRVVAAGHSAVEFWWPFADACPETREVDEFVHTISASGVRLAGMNLFAGDMAGGDRGILSWPDQSAEWESSVEVAAYVQQATGCRTFNALFGRSRSDLEPGEHYDAAISHLRVAANRLGGAGGTVVLEAVSGIPDYPLKHALDVVDFLDRAEQADIKHIGMLLDIYHLATNGDDVDLVIKRFAERTSHVQVADSPGRGYPGTGKLPIERWLRALESAGYRGDVALEFQGKNANPFWIDGDKTK